MILRGISLRKKDRIITPSDRIDADLFGQLLEIVKQTMLIRHIRLNIPPVRRDADEPVLPVIFQQIHIREHRCRILCAETDHVHNRRIEAVAADLIRVIGVADTDKAFFQSVRKPLGIEGRDVRSLSGINYSDRKSVV